MTTRPPGIEQRCLPSCGVRCKQHTWGYRLSLRAPDGSRLHFRAQGFPTMAAAVEARDERERTESVALVRPATVDAPATAVAEVSAPFTVADALNGWYARGIRNKKWKPSVQFGYRRYVEVDLGPALGHLPVTELRHWHVEDYYGRLFSREPRPLSATSIRRIHACLTAAWKDVLRDERVTVDYVARVELPRGRPKKAAPWSLAEWQVFAASQSGTRLWPLWLFVVESGMRRGEVVGLRWRDVDLDAGLLHVRSSIWEQRNRRFEGPPKSAAGEDRPIPLSAQVVAMLRQWQSDQRAEQARMVAAGVPGAVQAVAEGWVWTHESGTAWKGDEMYARFKRAQRAAGVRHVRLHDQRHLSATLGRLVGEDPLATRGRLGHASAAMTEHYTHIPPDRAAAEARSRLPRRRRAAGLRGSASAVWPLPADAEADVVEPEVGVQLGDEHDGARAPVLDGAGEPLLTDEPVGTGAPHPEQRAGLGHGEPGTAADAEVIESRHRCHDCVPFGRVGRHSSDATDVPGEARRGTDRPCRARSGMDLSHLDATGVPRPHRQEVSGGRRPGGLLLERIRDLTDPRLQGLTGRGRRLATRLGGIGVPACRGRAAGGPPGPLPALTVTSGPGRAASPVRRGSAVPGLVVGWVASGRPSRTRVERELGGPVLDGVGEVGQVVR